MLQTGRAPGVAGSGRAAGLRPRVSVPQRQAAHAHQGQQQRLRHGPHHVHGVQAARSVQAQLEDERAECTLTDD
ncbi:hypothetical protein ON010_g15516 [Phytophthora cinnamomi]|nr:hypothetical protein ON010_g15516 [Phytophthora cinnamomi]